MRLRYPSPVSQKERGPLWSPGGSLGAGPMRPASDTKRYATTRRP